MNTPFDMEWNGERFRCYVKGTNGRRLRIAIFKKEMVIDLLDENQEVIASESATYEDLETSLEP